MNISIELAPGRPRTSGFLCARSSQSSLAENETVLFVFLRPKIKEFIGLMAKSHGHLKTKAEWSRGLFSTERTKYWDKVWREKNDVTFGLSWVEAVFFGSTYLRFFSSGSWCCCLHSLDRVYKYREDGRQNKVSNFISTKNIVPLSSSEPTVRSTFLTLCWMGTQPVLHHYTVVQAARKYPFVKSGPHMKFKGENKNVRATLLTDSWSSLLWELNGHIWKL